MNQNADLHSPPHAPVHLSSAGCSSTTPSSPVVGAFGQWGEQAEALRSFGMGSIVNKAKAILRGKRHSYQWAGSADLRGEKDNSRPPHTRQSTLPSIPLASTFGGFSRRPTRRRNGGSVQISSPTLISGPTFGWEPPFGGEDVWPLDTEADITREFSHIRSSRSHNYERRSSLPTGIDGHVKCDRYSRSMSASTLVPPDTSYLAVGPPRAGSVPNLRGCGSTEFASSIDIPSEYDGICSSPRMIDGLELGVSDTMEAISEAGLLESSESEVLQEDAERLREALANMFPMVNVQTEDATSHANKSHDTADSPLYPLHVQERDEFGQLQPTPESASELMLSTNAIHSLWVPQDSWQPHLWSRSLYQLDVQSSGGPQQVEISSNGSCSPELSVMIELAAALSRPILKPLHIESVAPRNMLQVPSSAPPRVPARSPSRPNLAQRAHSSPVTSTLQTTNLRVPSRPRTPDLAPSACTLSRQASGSSAKAARSRKAAWSLSIVAQSDQFANPPPGPKPSRVNSLLHRGKSQSRLARMTGRSKSVKRPTPADISKPIKIEKSEDWIVISPPSRTLHPQRKQLRTSIRRSVYAQSSVSSRRSGMSRSASMRSGIVKSPSIRSGLTNLSTKPGLRASQSRSALHTRTRAGLYMHGVNPKLSKANLDGKLLRASASTRSLPDVSKENSVLSAEVPNRPPRSPARLHPESQLGPIIDKENRPAPRTEGASPIDFTASPIEFTLQLTAPFEAAIDRRFARSNFTVTPPPTPGLHRSRTTKTRPSGMSRKQELMEVHALAAGINGTSLRRSPTIAVPPRNPARLALSARSGNWV
ncbi:hypothetical protein RSOLAG1IB_08845 [Rhizoctonia solani AG-1 IB]|uniref:Uncharacterized protein n=1 Tax=Thanatephorus cucumeris (strain AG1-IB / isolate 7/3/14) TaxID=1108050 RepID=A0A0B7FLH6_THACB|nr:hypothetical protein RSOLAG1IB_08845 [Rhizoctonia solani AG-1 IB]